MTSRTEPKSTKSNKIGRKKRHNCEEKINLSRTKLNKPKQASKLFITNEIGINN